MGRSLAVFEDMLNAHRGWDLVRAYGLKDQGSISESLLRASYPHRDPSKKLYSINKAGFLMVVSPDRMIIHTDVSLTQGIENGFDMRDKIGFSNAKKDGPSWALMELLDEIWNAPRPLVVLTVGASPMRALRDIRINLDPDILTVSGEMVFEVSNHRIGMIDQFCEKWGAEPAPAYGLRIKINRSVENGFRDPLKDKNSVTAIKGLLGLKGAGRKDELADRERRIRGVCEDIMSLPSADDPSWSMSNFRFKKKQERSD